MLTFRGVGPSVQEWEPQEEESCRGDRCEGGGAGPEEEDGGERPVPEKIRSPDPLLTLVLGPGLRLEAPGWHTLRRPTAPGEDSFCLLPSALQSQSPMSSRCK